MVDAVRRLGAATSRTISDLGAMARFLLKVVRDALTPPWRLLNVVDEVYKLGVLSLLIICVCGLAVGMVLGLQGYNTLERFGATQALGALVGLSLSYALCAQQAPPVPMSPLKRTMLQKTDVPGTNYEAVTLIAEVVPNHSGVVLAA